MQGKYFCDGLRPEVEKREIEGDRERRRVERVLHSGRVFSDVKI